MRNPWIPPALCLAALLLIPPARGQDPPAEPAPGPANLGWLVGSWTGAVGDDVVEETWLAPAGGVMAGLFRWTKADAPYLYELLTLEPAGDGAVLKIKHFGPGLIGWEDKAASVVFDLAETGDGHAVFEKRGAAARLVYRRDGDGGMSVTLQEERGGSPVELVFRYERR